MGLIEEAQKKLGECFIIGIEGKTLADDTSAFLSQAGIGGVILFTDNYESPEQLVQLTNSIQDCRTQQPLWIAVDQEGGRVQRFKDPFTIIPTARELGATNSPKLIFEVAEVIAKELAAVGINLNFTPVVDIDTNPNNPIIGDRAYGTDAEQVCKMITGVVRGHVVAKVQPCVKHFPGHGDTDTDSHLELPRIRATLDSLKDREFKPFVRAFKSRGAMVMTAHIVCENIDPELPATLSPKILQEILREQLRYSRIIISDDMEMKAITDHFGVDEAPLMAKKAGCDLLIYRTEKAARHAYEVLHRALDQGNLDPKNVIESADRSQNLKKDFFEKYTPADAGQAKTLIGCAAHQEVMQKLQSPS